jgi:hypothetical protein
MKLLDIPFTDLETNADLTRSRSSKVFEEHLRASIEEMGIAEPLKVAAMPSGKYVVIDGIMRLRAIASIREDDPDAFDMVPGYVVDYAQRYEIRFQTDIYQDLLPSQLATLVEHLHESENVRKIDIARYIGVSPATLRNYTGLARLIERGGLFARVVELMDVGVMPASNPYAWLRLTPEGLEFALSHEFSGGGAVEAWIDERIAQARAGVVAPYHLKMVEEATNNLRPEHYREDEEVRTKKKELGLRRASRMGRSDTSVADTEAAIARLAHVEEQSEDRVLQVAARAMAVYLA